MTTYDEIKLEVEQRANSDEGFSLLLDRLLWKLPEDNPLVKEFKDALGRYVYAKRCLELWSKKGIERPWWKRPFGSLNAELCHEEAQEIEKRLIAEIGRDEVVRLKKEIGRSLQGILRKTK